MTHRHRGIDRRSFVAGAAVAGTALAGSLLSAPVVRAARTAKLGYVSPRTGPLAAFAEADSFVVDAYAVAMKNGPQVGDTA